MRFIYHYCTKRVNGNKVEVIDGIATRRKEIETMEDYKNLKKAIDPKHPESLTIVSLSLLKKKWF